MEQTLFRVHVRQIRAICGVLNKPARVLVEKLLLFLAVASLVVLYLLHVTYVSNNNPHYFGEGQLASNNCLSVALSRANIHDLQGLDVLKFTIVNEWDLSTPFLTLQSLAKSHDSASSLLGAVGSHIEWALDNRQRHDAADVGKDTCPGGQQCSPSERAHTSASFIVAREKGLLHLSKESVLAHNFTTATVTLSAQDDCFGPPAYVWLLEVYVGYSAVVKNWAIRAYKGEGFLFNEWTEEVFDFSVASEFLTKTGTNGTNASASAAAEPIVTSSSGGSRVSSLQHFIAFKVGVLLTTIFLFFTTTTLVSFTLRVTQERMLKFTFLLQYYISRSFPYEQLVITHLIETLVFVPVMIGMMFFLFEFFQDQMLAFFVLTTVWFYEVYAAVSVRTSISIRFFPRMFFVYFSLFHIYCFSFPVGFGYVALLSAVLFLTHTMWFFWNYYEVPAFEAGYITALQPRAQLIGSVLNFGDIHNPMQVSTREYQYQRRAGGAAFEIPQVRGPWAQQLQPLPNFGNAQQTGPQTQTQAPQPRRAVTEEELQQHNAAPTPEPALVTTSADGEDVGGGGGGGSGEHNDGPHTYTHAPVPRTAREQFDEHVALSKRIQRAQLAAMLGIAPDFDAHTYSQSSQAAPVQQQGSGSSGATPELGLNLDQ